MAADATTRAVPGPTRAARHRVRDGIEQLILSGRYQPGQRLVQQELAARFGVAQSVVRESLLELQFCGLVHAVDNLGMFVSGLDVETLLEAYEIRELFEGLAARRCCENTSRADLRQLTEMAREIYRLGSAGQLDAMSQLDRQFHGRMIEISGNPLLTRLTEGYRVLGMIVRANRAIRTVRDDHLAIVAAIEANRPAQAERVARRHVQAARAAIETQIREGTFQPHWVALDEPDDPAGGDRAETRRPGPSESARSAKPSP